ncbi:hypothetical protein BEP19_14900 [Ammoniphilus oxalaticus]|uniref:Phage portal protein n=1 Tax=Ammoniphilus oxalaticus TaxID=66863 RepID=A0A419SDA4_9BACL|nr:hypothetical protein [Ammoniphilus oxalaticus]RKD20970.1 hypothetical protein BEP19_14900 [Ammoniphilus oxalaticus]
MTISYIKKPFPPPPYDAEVAEMFYYRKLYDGDHEEIFPRARTIGQVKRYSLKRMGINRWRRIEQLESSNQEYIVVNFSSLIAELPSDLINRSLGNISADIEEGPELEFVESVVDASKPTEKIWAAVTQHQVDGRVAYRIRRNDRGKVWFEWIAGCQYFPHDDDDGADIAWIEEWGDEESKKEKYLRIERQRLTETGLSVQQLVFEMEGKTVNNEMDIKAYAQRYELFIPENVELEGVTELLCGYVPNDETLPNPRGRSALRNVDGIQEEINWTITRDAVIFDKHGKPKLAIPRKLWDTVAQKNNMHYGQHFVRNADLEVVSYDENNGAVPQYITWDAKLEESYKHVSRLIEYMMAVSKTSPEAAGIKDGRGNTGIALLYLWITSVIKAEAIQAKFDTAMKDAIRKCVILENAMSGADMEVMAPVIEWGDMMPKADSERDTEESNKYSQGVQSLETTVRRIHPDWSEEAIQAEIRKIEDENMIDSMDPTLIQPPKARVGE